MNNTPNRRSFLTLASSTLLSSLAGCSTTATGGSGYQIEVEPYDKSVFAHGTNLITVKGGDPFSESLIPHLPASNRLILEYQGTLTESKKIGNTYQANQNATGNVKTELEVNIDTNDFGKIEKRQFINGRRVSQYLETPPFERVSSFSFFRSGSGINPNINLQTGFHCPPMRFSRSINTGTVRCSPAGSRYVAAVGRSVPVWTWEVDTQFPNHSGQIIRSKHKNLISPNVPGQLVEYSYQISYDEYVTQKTSGKLVRFY